jgi:uncharacterized protein (DUF58 family)
VSRSRVKRIVKPGFVISLGLIMYLIAANSGAGWLYVVAAGIWAVVIVSVPLPHWNMRGIEVTRRAPAQATAGEPFECALEVRNTRRLGRHLLEIEDHLAGGTGKSVAVRVKSSHPEALRYAVGNPRRGVYSGGEVLIESGAPFGLYYVRRQARAASEVVVYPRTFDVAGLPPSDVVDAERGDSSESSTLHRGYAGELWGVREYRPGDPARLVAWKRSTRGLPAGRLAVVELARETQPPFVVALDLDPRAPREARERVISLGASLLLYALAENREVRAYAGPENPSFPEEVNRDSVLTWCAGLRASPPPDLESASVEIRPSTRKIVPVTEPRPSPLSGSSGARVVVLVSCHAFAGEGSWLNPGEEREFVERSEANGRLVARLGAEIEEPWSIQ